MRKTFMTSLIVLLAVVLVYSFADAAITGRCVSCHTMHNSQGGVDVAVLTGGGATTDTAFAHLTVSSCVGCHTGTWGDTRPVVDATGSNIRAGGTFNTSEATTAQRRHDVIQYTGLGEDVLSTAPGNTGSDITFANLSSFSCAGEFGCHGKHTAGMDNDEGIQGFHHGGGLGLYAGYRFLQLTTGTAIPGVGSPTWEYNGGSGPTASDHNVYSEGSVDHSDGISRYCATCHGQFHGTANTGSSGAWLRHPTEEILLSDWSYNTTGGYSTHPVAFSDAFITGNTVTTSTDYAANWTAGKNLKSGARVMCLSCHRAHGSAYDDLLRFSYTAAESGEQRAGGSVSYGCLGCHSKQRAP